MTTMTPPRLFLLLLLLITCLTLSHTQTCSTNNTKTLLVKIGGSCITDKAQLETLNQSMVDWFSKVLASRPQNHNLILVHGAGSFGHFQAKLYGLTSQASIISPRGIAETRRSVQTLNQHVLASLLRHNLDAVSLSPGLLGYPCYSDEFAAALGRAVRQVLQAGLIPVLHGDVCLSADGRTAAIVGGDDLLKRLASMAQQAIFLTDVPAIYTSDPRVHPDAEMVPEIFVDENGDIVSTAATGTIDASDSTHPHDVTGGLRSKLSAATIMASQGTRVMVVQCGTRSAEQALFGEEVDVGTRVVHSA